MKANMKPDLKSQLALLLLALVAVVLLSACGESTPVALSPGEPPTPAPTEVPATATPEPTYTATPTDTPVPPTPTTRPTSTPVPDLQEVLRDDFSSTCNLNRVNDERNTLECADGEYVMLNKTGTWWRWVGYTRIIEDVIVEADARMVSGSGWIGYGLVWRLSSGSNSYHAFLITTNGQFMVYTYDRPDRYNLISLTPSSAIQRGTAANHLKVAVQGNQAAVYVNNRWLNTVVSASAGSGRVGFILWSEQPGVKVAFDNIGVTKINRPIVLPPPQPSPGAVTPTRTPRPQPTATPAPEFQLRFNFKAFERWGRPDPSNCALKDDTSPVMRLTWDVVVTNLSDKALTDEDWRWPVVYDNTGGEVIHTCWYGGWQIAPGGTGTVTFTEYVEMGRWVSRIVFGIRNSNYQVCLDASLKQISC